MASIGYKQIDVFTDMVFSGNQAAAVFLDSELELDRTQKQKIANELKLSETVFISNSNLEADYKLEYFTPLTELALAGHPTIAACYALASDGKLFLSEPITTIKFETGAGIINCQLHIENGSVAKVMMEQINPTFKIFDDKDKLLDALRLEDDSLVADLPVEFISTGLECLIVPLTDLKTVQTLEPDFNRLPWNTLVFCSESVSPFATSHNRFFAPKLGVIEDPATGTASGSLGCYLIKNRVIRGSSPVTMVFEQGLEIGRPSEITVEISFGSEIKNVKVGGIATVAAEGNMYL
jgi:trans-2,3-dihydro-3-hydroxyanthranilate isomerase